MTDLTFPSLVFPSGATRYPQSATLQLLPVTQSSSSPFDGSVQTIAVPGAKWSANLVWGPMPPDQWRVLMAFLSSLNGPAGRFTYNHPMTWRRSSTAAGSAGSPAVNGASQTGTTLVTNGWTHSVQVFAAGDFFSFVDTAGLVRMHQVTATVSSDSGGNATLPIAPPLRTSPASGAALTIDYPLARWMLATDRQGDIAASAKDAGGRAQTSLEIVEALV